MLRNEMAFNDAGPSVGVSDCQSQTGEEKFPYRQKRRHPPETKQICRVCGDKALSVNFNVVTCESCKAFFRRNALKTKETRCETSGNCEINVRSRRSCKKCRLRKCFEVGMIKEWIMSDDARVRKRQLIEQNREKRRLAAMNMACGDTSDGEAETVSEETHSTLIDFGPSATPAANGRHWQPPCVQTDRFSHSLSSAFQQAPDSAFRPPSMMSMSNSSTPAPMGTTLPTRPAIVQAQMEEMVRVPKNLLAALVNQCQTIAAPCPQHEAAAQSRPSVIVTKAPGPMRCICRCRCGACASWPRPSEDTGAADKYVEENETSERNEADGDDGESSADSLVQCSPNSDNQLALIGGSEGTFQFNVNFGISGSKLFHLVDLLSAFDFPNRPIGRRKEETAISPGPPIDLDCAAVCVQRMDAMVRRLLQFGRRIAISSGLKRNVIATLVKAACGPLVLLHSTLAYSPEADGWFDAGPNVRSVNAKQLIHLNGGVYNEHTKFVSSFPGSCKEDVSIGVIMFAIAFFNPALVSAKDRAYVRTMKEFYIGLLAQYLNSKFHSDKACQLRDKILAHVDTSLRVADRLTPTMIVELNDRDMEPLMIDYLGYAARIK